LPQSVPNSVRRKEIKAWLLQKTVELWLVKILEKNTGIANVHISVSYRLFRKTTDKR